jgi:polyhydroxyalkanoate synthesis repressor PhaR
MSRQEAPKQLDIRKYPNRRYYDATYSRHLTLEEILDRVRQGYDIKVTDSKTGADITAQVLTQMILELETKKIENLPVTLLLNLIRSNDQFLHDFVEKYFNQALNAYLEYQKQMARFAPFSAWPQMMLTPFTGPASPANEPEDLRKIISGLQKQLEELQKELKTAKANRSKR